jgi:DNA-directed RNA polymerase subunit RPC12/RpoP
MREIACEQCGRRVTVGDDTVMCPSCGFAISPTAQPVAAPLGMDTGISGVDTRVATAPVALAATATPAAAGGQIVCAQCGRSVTPGAGMAAVCPSCGFALSAPAALAATDVSAMETRVAPMPAPTPIVVPVETPAPMAVAAGGSASGVDTAATRVADAAPIVAAERADTAATQVAEGGTSMSPETPETRPAGMPYGQPPTPTPYPGQPAFGQAPDGQQSPYGQPMYGQPQPEMPPTATYPYSAYPGYLSGPMMSPAPPPPSKKTPVALIAVLVALAVVVVAGVLFAALALARGGSFVGATATATAVPTATSIPTVTPSPTASTANIPSGFTVYRDPAGLYQIAYSADWAKTESSQQGVNTAIFTDSSQRSTGLELTPVALQVPQSGLANLDDSFITGFAKGAANATVTNKQGPSNVTLAGETFVQESADVQTSSATVHLVVLAGVHGSTTYNIAYFAAAGDFSGTDAQFFQPMLRSLIFLK